MKLPKETLEEILERYDVFTPYPNKESWVFNTSIAADVIARKILGRLKGDSVE